jgi:hypothetical protein
LKFPSTAPCTGAVLFLGLMARRVHSLCDADGIVVFRASSSRSGNVADLGRGVGLAVHLRGQREVASECGTLGVGGGDSFTRQ